MAHDVDDAGLAALVRGASDVTDLELAGKRVATLTDDGLAPLATLTSLRRLKISGAKQLRGAGLIHLAALPLELLDLGACGLGPEAVEPLTRLRTLTSLWLPYNKRLKVDAVVALLAAGLPLQHADGLDAAKEALAEQRAAAAPERSFYLLDAYDNAGFAHVALLHLSADLDDLRRALTAFVADADPSTIRVELRVYEASRRVARHALKPPAWKLPRVRALSGTRLTAGETTAVRDPGEVPLTLRHGANDG